MNPHLIRRPQLNYEVLAPFDPTRPALPYEVFEQVEISLKYEGYIKKQEAQIKELRRIESKKIPEDLDYTGVFDEVLENYTSTYELIKVATSNMGSLYKLTYDLKLKDASKEKEMIDELRCRNGNLEIILSRKDTAVAEL